MPKVVDTARVTTRAGVVWRQCAGCGTPAPLAGDVDRCVGCRVDPVRVASIRVSGGRAPRSRRELVGRLAGTGVTAAREVYTRSASDVLRVAALVEIAGAAATLARTVAKFHHLDPQLVAPYVRERVDLAAVLGRGRWLPTMTRHVPAPPSGPVPAGVLLPLLAPARAHRRAVRRTVAQASLFDVAGAGDR